MAHSLHPLSLLIQHLLHIRSVRQPLQPSLNIRELLCSIILLRGNFLSPRLPWNESNVCVSDLVTNQVVVSAELSFKDSRDSLDLIEISVDGAGEFLGVEPTEPPVSC